MHLYKCKMFSIKIQLLEITPYILNIHAIICIIYSVLQGIGRLEDKYSIKKLRTFKRSNISFQYVCVCIYMNCLKQLQTFSLSSVNSFLLSQLLTNKRYTFITKDMVGYLRQYSY